MSEKAKYGLIGVAIVLASIAIIILSIKSMIE